MPIAPYVVGQWVRAEKFYGREALLEEILHGHREGLWLLGTRRIGKTSILKQLEHLTVSSPELGYVPLFWDFQGAEEPDDLRASFVESLFEADDRLADLDIEVETDDLFVALNQLRRALRTRRKTLLLLADEVEELVTVNQRSPRFLRRLRRALQSAEGVRTVLASKIRLWDLATEETSTSPFLHGFTPPLVVNGLTEDEAKALVRQEQLPPHSRPNLDDGVVDSICSRCNNHPYLLQLIGERTVERGDLEVATEEIAADPMVSHFFGFDFEMLTGRERDIIRVVGADGEATTAAIEQRLLPSSGSAPLRADLQRLEHLGFIRRAAEGGYALANYFFGRWYDELPEAERMLAVEASAQPTIRDGAPPRVVDDRYELLESLGAGTSGQVFRAHDKLLRTVVALKLLKAECCADLESLERLRREVLLARDLSHPNLLKVYHLGEDQGQPYVTMQFIDGPDLAHVLLDEAPLPVERAVQLGARLAGALQAAHERKVLHRDIKPSNIMIDRHGEPRIADFGLARLVDGPAITRNGIFVGTPAYASPEQILDRELDERSDLYSLGAVLYEMVTGRRPFVGTVGVEVLKMHLNEQPPYPGDLRPELPEALSDLVLRCLVKDPAQRLQSAQALATALVAMYPRVRARNFLSPTSTVPRRSAPKPTTLINDNDALP